MMYEQGLSECHAALAIAKAIDEWVKLLAAERERAEKAELRVHELEAELIQQSEMVQRDWASPYEVAGFKGQIAHLESEIAQMQFRAETQQIGHNICKKVLEITMQRAARLEALLQEIEAMSRHYDEPVPTSLYEELLVRIGDTARSTLEGGERWMNNDWLDTRKPVGLPRKLK